MGSPREGRLLSILLELWTASFAAAGLHAPPPPTCSIPCVATSCQVDIRCSWAEWQDALAPANYSLHWATAYGGGGHVSTGPSRRGSIPRRHFSSHSELSVWVQARGPNRTLSSDMVSFNTGNIAKPLPPTLTWSSQEPPEMAWTSVCDQPHLSMGKCEVRYRQEKDGAWMSEEIGFSVSFELGEDVRPGTVYEGQVRCACGSGFQSDWSETLKLRTPESRPAGELDVWKDCGPVSPGTTDCVVIWRKLPELQAHGLILGYEVQLSYNNGSDMLFNVSAFGPAGRLVCEEMQCYLNSSLTDASSAGVSAYNSRGATAPSYLPRTVPGQKVEHVVRILMDNDSLTASWDPLPDSASLKEYVLQYKEAGRPLGQGFHWRRVNSSTTTTVLQGPFHEFRQYQVSLFTVSHHNQSRLRSSVPAYSGHGTPFRVETLRAIHVSTTHATLFWEALPLSSQNGVLLCYQIGLNGQSEVHTVHASPEHVNMTYELRGLRPGRLYEAWIKAVTRAGDGAKSTTKFKTQLEFGNTLSRNVLLIILGTGLLFIISCSISVRACVREEYCCPLASIFYEKVPDPENSKIFKLMKLQLNEPLPSMRLPSQEPLPTISSLEVVRLQPAPETLPDGPLRADRPTDCEWPVPTADPEPYSQMVDSQRSDKEPNTEDSWSSSEGEQFISSYEKHFMPTAQEVLQC